MQHREDEIYQAKIEIEAIENKTISPDTIDLHEAETELAKFTLESVAQSKVLTTILRNAAAKIQVTVFDEIFRRAKAHKFSLNQLDPASTLYKSLCFLIEEHSADKNQRLGIFRDQPAKEIKNSPQKIQYLLYMIEERLKVKPTNQDRKLKNGFLFIMQAAKAITDLSFCYVEYFTHTVNYGQIQQLYSLIGPNVFETSSRITYQSYFDKPRYSLTPGISRKDEDFSEDSSEESFVSGKSVFKEVDTKERIKKIIREFDNINIALECANKSNSTLTTPDALDNKYLYCAPERLAAAYEKYKKFMGQYNIPLNKKERQDDLNVYSMETNFEKLMQDPKTGIHYPVIAGVSGTLGRSLTTLYAINFFQLDVNEEKLNENFEHTKSLMNILAATIVYGAHHSIGECAETFNRLLDVVMKKNTDAREANHTFTLFSANNDIPYINNPAAPERKMPYFSFGNYASFFSNEMRRKLLKYTQELPATIKVLIKEMNL